MPRLIRVLLIAGVLILLSFRLTGWLSSGGPFGPRTERMVYSTFLRCLGAGQIRSVELGRRSATGVVARPGEAPHRFTVELPQGDAAEGWLTQRLAAEVELHSDLQVATPAPVLSETLQNIFVSVLIPLGAIVILWVLFWRQAQSTGSAAVASTAYATYPGRSPSADLPRPAGRRERDSMAEQTFVMIKPDGVRKNLVGECIRRFEQRGLKLVELKMLTPSRDLAETHYGAHRDKPFFAGVVEFITSGPVVAMVLEGESAIAAVRQMVGATRPLEAAPGSIRGDFALNVGENIVHASDGPETATEEIALWFGNR